MNRIALVRLCGAALFLLGSWAAYTQNPPAAGRLTVDKVKDDLYEIVGDGGNVAVYVTGEGVIMIDDKYGRDFDQIVEKVKGFGRARQPPLLGWIAFEPLMVILISILREEVNSSPEPLGLRYMELG